MKTDLIQQAFEIEEQEAREAGALGFMARAMVLATLPHKKTPEAVHKRKNGNYSLVMLADPEVGLPYGTVPRLVLAWMTTEALRTRSRELELGDTLSAFMRELEMAPTGGRHGTITRLRDQLQRLFACSVSCTYDDGERWSLRNVTPVDEATLWWSPKAPDQAGLWKSTVTLGEKFYDEIIDRPVPLDMRALKALRRSPLALDLYCWLTYRLSYLGKSTEIPMAALRLQFGADYGRLDNFTAAFDAALTKVRLVYPEARVERSRRGLKLAPSKPHIQKRP